VTAVLGAAALLLVVAGLLKVRDPGPARAALARARTPLPEWSVSPAAVRAGGLVQALVGVAILATGGRTAGALVLVSFTALALASWRMAAVAPGSSCGCFGEVDAPAHWWHVAANAGLAAAGAVAVAWPQPGLAAVVADRPLIAVPLALLTVTLAYAAFLVMTALPALVTRTGATA
jgi:hypothetical protein